MKPEPCKLAEFRENGSDRRRRGVERIVVYPDRKCPPVLDDGNIDSMLVQKSRREQLDLETRGRFSPDRADFPETDLAIQVICQISQCFRNR